MTYAERMPVIESIVITLVAWVVLVNRGVGVARATRGVYNGNSWQPVVIANRIHKQLRTSAVLCIVPARAKSGLLVPDIVNDSTQNRWSWRFYINVVRQRYTESAVSTRDCIAFSHWLTERDQTSCYTSRAYCLATRSGLLRIHADSAKLIAQCSSCLQINIAHYQIGKTIKHWQKPQSNYN